MGFSERVDLMGQNMKTGTKNASFAILSTTLRLVTGLMLGIVISLIMQVLMSLGQFSVVLLTVVIIGTFWRLSRDWSISKILIFDVIATLVAVILRMYIYLAP